jgi:hypothetical protein
MTRLASLILLALSLAISGPSFAAEGTSPGAAER